MAKSTSKLFNDKVSKTARVDDTNKQEEKDIFEDAIDNSIKDMENKKDELVDQVIEKDDDVSTEASSEVSMPASDSNDVQDIQISAVKKKRFRINGDNNKIIELDTGDVGISYRLTDAYTRLNKLMEKVGRKLEGADLDDENSESVIEITESLKELDTAMKKEIDYIFNAPVADICSNGASMYKPYEGMFVYEHIIDVITELYATDLNREFTAMRRRVAEQTAKYTRGKSPTKKYTKH